MLNIAEGVESNARNHPDRAAIVEGDKVTVNGADHSNGYKITAVPQTVGKTGDRGFCSDQFGNIKYDLAGGTNCTQGLQ